MFAVHAVEEEIEFNLIVDGKNPKKIEIL